jgi:hypothetical protein
MRRYMLEKACFILPFPFLGILLTWPVEELMLVLNSRRTPIPLLVVVMVTGVGTADKIEQWNYEKWWAKRSQENRLKDALQEDVAGALACVHCEPEQFTLAPWACMVSSSRRKTTRRQRGCSRTIESENTRRGTGLLSRQKRLSGNNG